MNTSHLLVIEIGGTNLRIRAGRADGTWLSDDEKIGSFAVSRAAGGAGIREQLAKILPQFVTTIQPSAIGVGFGGPVDWRTGQIRCSHQVPGWFDFPLAAWLHELTGVPAFIDNDTNVAALAEARCGAGRGAEPCFYANFGSGVGGGLIVNGSIYHGAVPGEVEFGHLRLDRAGVTVEDRCSGWSVDQAVQKAIAADPHGTLAKCADGASPPAAWLTAALQRDDPAARRILAELADDTAFALSHMVHLFHPAVIVLGGGLSQLGEPWVTSIANRLPAYIMESFQPGPPVRLSELGSQVVPVGALLMAAERLRILQ